MTSRIPKPGWMRPERTFETYADQDWLAVMDWLGQTGTSMLRTSGRISETFVVFRERYGRPEIEQADLSFMHDAPRGLQRAVLGRLLVKLNAFAYAIMSEAWTVTTTDEARVRKHNERWGSIAGEPDREEMLIIGLATRTGFKRFRSGRMVRITGERGTGLVERIDWNSDIHESGGVMLNLFELGRGEQLPTLEEEIAAMKAKVES